MNLRRFEILLPLNYNDGKPIEHGKFALTHQELIRRFGATTVDTIKSSGTWLYRGTVYEDVLMRIIVDSPEPEEATTFLREYKEILKARFDQLDIWITAHDVEMI